MISRLLSQKLRQLERPVLPQSMANKAEGHHRDDDAQRGGESDADNYEPHASRGIIKAIKFTQHWGHPLLAAKPSIIPAPWRNWPRSAAASHRG
jgi:hypothetical protein